MADWGQYVTEIFGKRAGVGIGILIDQFDRLKSKFPDLEHGAPRVRRRVEGAAEDRRPAVEGS